MAKEPTQKKKSRKILLPLLTLLLIVGLAVFGGYYFKKYSDLKNNPITPEQAQQAEQNRITAAVGKLYSLPKDEQPQIVFVKDKTKLTDQQKQQELFQKSETGDYLLVYTKNKLAVLYRPSEKRIVDARPITVQQSVTVKVIGADADRTAVKTALASTFKNDVTVKDEGTANGTYTGVTVVDVSGNNSELAKKLAAGLKGTVVTLPSSETKPNTDILIIAGAPAATPAP